MKLTRSSDLQSLAPAPRLEDIAEALGISASTVSRVVNGTGNVSELMRARVQVAISAFGYVPNAHARSLKQRKNARVALLSSVPNDGYLLQLLIGALDQAAQQNVQLLFRRERGRDSPLEEARALLRQGVNGFLLTPPFGSSGAMLALLDEAGAERVILGDRTPQVDLPVVGIDNEAAAYDMTVHLLELGHRQIAHIVGDKSHTASRYRLNGYRRALADFGVAPREEFEAQGEFTFDSGLAATRRLLALPDRPTAIFAANDDMAAGAIRAASLSGLAVPRQLSVCGFDDTMTATSITPALTTIRQPVRMIAAEGLKLLLRRIARAPHHPEEPPHQVLLGFDLIRRDSCAAPETL